MELWEHLQMTARWLQSWAFIGILSEKTLLDFYHHQEKTQIIHFCFCDLLNQWQLICLCYTFQIFANVSLWSAHFSMSSVFSFFLSLYFNFNLVFEENTKSIFNLPCLFFNNASSVFRQFKDYCCPKVNLWNISSM